MFGSCRRTFQVHRPVSDPSLRREIHVILTLVHTCRVAAFAAKAAVDANEPGSVMGICQAMLQLSSLSAQLSESHLKPLAIVEPISQRVHAQQTAVKHLVFKQLQNVCSHEFNAADFDRLTTLHVLDVHSGAELPERIRDAFLNLVSSSDQYQPGERPPSVLQSLLAKERSAVQASRSQWSSKEGGNSSSTSPAGSARDSLTVLYRAVPAVKFRGMAERVMQKQFVWLQTFHAMQMHVHSELQDARTVLLAVDNGAALEVDWSGGLPEVRVVPGSTMGCGTPAAEDPSGVGTLDTSDKMSPDDSSPVGTTQKQEDDTNVSHHVGDTAAVTAHSSSATADASTNSTQQVHEATDAGMNNISAAAHPAEASGGSAMEPYSKDGADDSASAWGHTKGGQNGATIGVSHAEDVSVQLSVGSGTPEKPVLVQLAPRNTVHDSTDEVQSKLPSTQGSAPRSRSTTTAGAATDHLIADTNSTTRVAPMQQTGEQNERELGEAVDNYPQIDVAFDTTALQKLPPAMQQTASPVASSAGDEDRFVQSEDGEGAVPLGESIEGGSVDGARSPLRARHHRGYREGPWGSSVASEPRGEQEEQIMGSLAGHPLSLEEFVKQRERILHRVRSIHCFFLVQCVRMKIMQV